MILAYENNNDEYFSLLLGYNEQQIQKIKKRILSLNKRIIERYPSIKEQVMVQQKQKCNSCDFNKLIANWDEMVLKYNNQHRRKLAVDPAICEMVPLVVGIVVCAATAGASVLLYAACTYVVVCSFCEGGWADDICAF